MMDINVKKELKKKAREEFEEHFYATWPAYLDTLNYEQLQRLNSEKLADVNSSYPETMLWLKTHVLTRLAIMEMKNDAPA